MLVNIVDEGGNGECMMAGLSQGFARLGCSRRVMSALHAIPIMHDTINVRIQYVHVSAFRGTRDVKGICHSFVKR